MDDDTVIVLERKTIAGRDRSLEMIAARLAHFVNLHLDEPDANDSCAFVRVCHTIAAMSDSNENLRLTKSEYLAWEREQLEKHEYHLGKIVPYGSRGPRHNCLTVGVMAEIAAALRGKKCYPFSPGQRISIANGQHYVYPDVSVACGTVRSEPGTTDVLENPMVIVEVLSASTEKFDRGDKWGAYQKIESLKDYLLVSQSAARIEHYQRQADGSWRYIVAESGGSITLSNDARMSVDDIYAGAFAIPGDE